MNVETSSEVSMKKPSTKTIESESIRSLIMPMKACSCFGTSQMVLSESCSSPNAPEALTQSRMKLSTVPSDKAAVLPAWVRISCTTLPPSAPTKSLICATSRVVASSRFIKRLTTDKIKMMSGASENAV